ncbi:accessory gene regulator ArgB-like protein [Desulfallas thermosapovorans]|uniref:Accessory gene regulator B n=1 Tax=Desulfallas thermosapovorans DSM 6562 TaxID=1121431 RepID=A0A5S4ZT29_9FIRM|nr:accessory gene regulator B family protein [Desulfallas thermosapovorans]TYO95321.1 accessory gene regulator B [Desulfallas thermosapovorans DSM 6562]
MSYLPISKRIAGYLSARTGISDEQEEIVTYFIEVTLINIFNTLNILLLGLFFGTLPGIITCLITVAMLRQTAGGAHSNSPWRCALITAVVFLSISVAASYLSHIKQIYLDSLAIAAVLIGTFLIILLAPVDSPSAPILSDARRKRLKIMALIIMGIISVAIILLRQSSWIYALEAQAAVVLSVFWTSFNLTRFGHHVMSYIDNLKIGSREVNH